MRHFATALLLGGWLALPAFLRAEETTPAATPSAAEKTPASAAKPETAAPDFDTKDDKFDWSIWGKIPVLHDGRVKPFDSMAREFMSTLVGRHALKAPEHFATFSSSDVRDWNALYAWLATGEMEGIKTLVGLLPPALVERIKQRHAETNPVQPDVLLGQIQALDYQLGQPKLKAQDLMKRTLSDAEFRELMEEQGSQEVLALFAERDKLEEQLGQIQLTRAQLVLALNDLVSGPLLPGATLPSPETGSSTNGKAATHEVIARAAANRQWLDDKIGQVALYAWVPGKPLYGKATVEARKYGPVEALVTWMLTWQGWDELTSFEQLDEGRDDVNYWKFHEADAWDRLPMIEVGYNGTGWANRLDWRIQPELIHKASIFTLAGPRAHRKPAGSPFENWALAAQRRRDADPVYYVQPTVEEKGVRAFSDYVHFTQLRMGYSISAIATDRKVEEEGRLRSDNWLPIAALLIKGHPAMASLDQQAVDKARTAFMQARTGLITGDAERFNRWSRELADALQTIGQSSPLYPPEKAIATEWHYNQFQPFQKTWLLAFGATLLLAISLGTKNRVIFGVGIALFLGAIACSAYGMALRSIISGRAPVTNMFETLIWSSFVASVLALVLSSVYRVRIIPMSAAALLTFGTVLADNMPPNMGSSIAPLVPVLRSNYWLVIHVLTIVASYGAFALAWILGNVGLAMCLAGKDKSEELKPMALFAYRAMQVGVLLLTAGTILGGWWAADSWGRFWGWDPKETWALIAILAYLVLLHLRMFGAIKIFGLMAGAVLCFSAVVMAWYGVNFVLGRGLHAYGFGDGGQPYVFSLAGLNILYVFVAWLLYRGGSRIVNKLPSPPSPAPAKEKAKAEQKSPVELLMEANAKLATSSSSAEEPVVSAKKEKALAGPATELDELAEKA